MRRQSTPWCAVLLLSTLVVAGCKRERIEQSPNPIVVPDAKQITVLAQYNSIPLCPGFAVQPGNLPVTQATGGQGDFGDFRINVPPGAVEADMVLEIARGLDADRPVVSITAPQESKGVIFKQPVTIMMSAANCKGIGGKPLRIVKLVPNRPAEALARGGTRAPDAPMWVVTQIEGLSDFSLAFP